MSAPRDAEELFDPDAKASSDADRINGPPPKANNPQDLKAKGITDRQREIQDGNDLTAVLSAPSGVRFVVRLLMRCGIDQPNFHASNSMMCEIAGRRQIANDLRDWVKNCGLDEWFKIEREFENYRPKPKKFTSTPRAP